MTVTSATKTGKGFRGLPQLTETEARSITNSIKVDLTSAYIGIIRAYQGRAWLSLGYTSWSEYCREEFEGMFRHKFDDDELTNICRELMEAGLSLRSVSAATGVSLGRVHKRAPKDRPERLTGADGKERPARRLRIVSDETPPVQEDPEPIVTDGISQSDWAVLMVGEASLRGLTYKELNNTANNWTHAQSSNALSRAHKRGQIAPSGRFRDGCSVYVLPAHATMNPDSSTDTESE